MSLLGSLVNRYKEIILWGTDIFYPTESRDISILYKGTNFCRAHQIKTPTLESFIRYHVLPELNSRETATDKKLLKNMAYIFPAIRQYPLYINKEEGIFFEKGGTNLYIDGDTFSEKRAYTFQEVEKKFVTRTQDRSKSEIDHPAHLICSGSEKYIQQDIDSFFMHTDVDNFFFLGTTIQIEVVEDRMLGVRIKEPTIPDPDYKHPFLYSNTKLCFGNERRWKDNDIHFRFVQKYQTSEYIQMIKRTFRETENLLKNGYYGEVSPVYTLNRREFNEEVIDLRQQSNLRGESFLILQ